MTPTNPFAPLVPFRDGKPQPLVVPPGGLAGAPPRPTPPVAAGYSGPVVVPPLTDTSALSLFADRQREMNDAAAGAFAVIDRPLDSFLWWPWQSMHALTGSIPPEELWIIAGMSGAGKTTLKMSIADVWSSQGIPVMYVGLEMPPKVLTIHLACRRLALRGIILHPGDVLKGRLMPGHPERLPDAEMLRAVLRDEIEYIRRELAEVIRFVPVAWLTAENLRRICEQAAAWGIKAIIVDHLDQVDPDGNAVSSYDEHQRMLKVLHSATRQYGVTVIGGAQLNTDSLKRPGATVRSHQRPSTEFVQYGMLKRRISDALLILFKPLPPPPERAEDADAYRSAMTIVREDQSRIDRYLIPNTMGVVLDKDRAYGRDGAIGYLGVHASRITDANPADADMAMRRLLSLARPDGRALPAGPAPAPAPGRHRVIPLPAPTPTPNAAQPPLNANWYDDDDE